MKKTIKSYLIALALLPLFGALVAPVAALSYEDAAMKIADALLAAERVASNDTKCLNLDYVGSSTEAVVTITKTDLIGYAPEGTKDANFGLSASTYVLNSAAYDTMGEVCDAVDGLTDYECTLLGCKRDDNSNLLRDQTAASGTNDLAASGGFDVKMDTGSAQVLTDVNQISIGITPLSGRRVLLKQSVANISVIGTMNVYGKLRKYENANDGVTRDDTTLVWSGITANDTDLTTTWSITGQGGLEFAKDAHVVVRGATPLTLVADAQVAANFLQLYWEER